MALALDLVGEKFDRLRVIAPLKRRDKHGRRVWRCLCDCGAEAFLTTWKLRTGNTRSCGCLRAEMAAELTRDDPHRRFQKKHSVDESGCWIWHRRPTTARYAIFYLGTQMPAHRASWILHRGAIPDGLHVLHKCDVPLCVNPDHLFLGTHPTNMADMKAKGRARSGRARRASDL